MLLFDIANQAIQILSFLGICVLPETLKRKAHCFRLQAINNIHITVHTALGSMPSVPRPGKPWTALDKILLECTSEITL